MAIRCYIPTTLSALESGLGSLHAVAPDSAGRSLGGEDLEAQEFDALCIAAALAAAQSFDAADQAASTDESDDHQTVDASPRAVVAYDAPDSAAHEQLTDGFDLLSLESVDMGAVVSIHIDEAQLWSEATSIARDAGRDAAEDRLGESDLLWYDVSELSELLRERS